MAIKSNAIEEVSNEVEIFEFIVNNQSYGVNVLKIRQIIRFEKDKLSKPPKVIPALIGLIKILNRMVPIIDLNQAFYGTSDTSKTAEADANKVNQIIIVLEFNRSWFGFLVDNVNKIHRFNYEEVKGVENGMTIEYVNSTITLQDRTIFSLDFEYLVSKLFYAETYLKVKPVGDSKEMAHVNASRTVLVVDDSKVMREVVNNFLTEVGYKNIVMASNGKEGFDKFKAGFDEKTFASKYDVILSDIEMPSVDGFTFCRNVKDLKNNQVFILLSSLSSKQLQAQSQEVGADKMVSKKDIDKLHLIINDLCK